MLDEGGSGKCKTNCLSSSDHGEVNFWQASSSAEVQVFGQMDHECTTWKWTKSHQLYIKEVLGNPKNFVSALQTTWKYIFGWPEVPISGGASFCRVDHECRTLPWTKSHYTVQIIRGTNLAVSAFYYAQFCALTKLFFCSKVDAERFCPRARVDTKCVRMKNNFNMEVKPCRCKSRLLIFWCFQASFNAFRN